VSVPTIHGAGDRGSPGRGLTQGGAAPVVVRRQVTLEMRVEVWVSGRDQNADSAEAICCAGRHPTSYAVPTEAKGVWVGRQE
jgi:hypothetical protein